MSFPIRSRSTDAPLVRHLDLLPFAHRQEYGGTALFSGMACVDYSPRFGFAFAIRSTGTPTLAQGVYTTPGFADWELTNHATLLFADSHVVAVTGATVGIMAIYKVFPGTNQYRSAFSATVGGTMAVGGYVHPDASVETDAGVRVFLRYCPLFSRWLCMTSGDNGAGQVLKVCYSDNNGTTWTTSTPGGPLLDVADATEIDMDPVTGACVLAQANRTFISNDAGVNWVELTAHTAFAGALGSAYVISGYGYGVASLTAGVTQEHYLYPWDHETLGTWITMNTPSAAQLGGVGPPFPYFKVRSLGNGLLYANAHNRTWVAKAVPGATWTRLPLAWTIDAVVPLSPARHANPRNTGGVLVDLADKVRISGAVLPSFGAGF